MKNPQSPDGGVSNAAVRVLAPGKRRVSVLFDSIREVRGAVLFAATPTSEEQSSHLVEIREKPCLDADTFLFGSKESEKGNFLRGFETVKARPW